MDALVLYDLFQKAACKRERNLAGQKAEAKSQLKVNAAALASRTCKICRQGFMPTVNREQLGQHVENKHPKATFADCFDGFDQ